MLAGELHFTKIIVSTFFKGVNTGVALYCLSCMRRSQVYNRQLEEDQLKSLSKKYDFEISLAEQDWFTQLGWELKELFYSLPCKFNVQTDTEYEVEEFEHLWKLFRECGEKTAILHLNGVL